MFEYNIAVVDDDPLSLMQAKMLLTEEKMHVNCMNSGKQLLKYIENNTPDLILLDILMPEDDGFEVYIKLRRFEEHSGRAHIPVIFFSGEDDASTEEMGLVLGASDFIKKPFNKDVLVRRIHNSIKNSRKIGNLEEEATLDKLTGFLNKAKGTERISKLCRRKNGALMILDLDSFKLVNDLYGHDKGDQILKAIASIMKKNSRETDTLCRIGGDEFAVIMKDTGSALRDLIAEKIHHVNMLMQSPTDNTPVASLSAGVAFGDRKNPTGNIYEDADIALYRAKDKGRNCLAFYEDPV